MKPTLKFGSFFRVLGMVSIGGLLAGACGGEDRQDEAALSPASAIRGLTAHTDQTDEPLSRIAEEAQRNFPTFLRYVQNSDAAGGDFRVKYPLETDEGSGFRYEYVWLRDIVYHDSLFYGRLSNKPFYISGLRIGDAIAFDPEKISDWLYLSDGEMVGGRSIKYLTERLLNQGSAIELSAYPEFSEGSL